ncbi:MAG: VOC family protein [Thermoplasmata archaeon]|nr:VOC family protein [Thermoplasmata archaeon]
MPPTSVRAELRHVVLEVSDPARSKRFHDRVLGRLGFRRFVEDPGYLGYTNGTTTLWLIRPTSARIHRKPPTGEEEVIGDHLAFEVPSAEEVGRVQEDLARQEIYPIFRMAEHPEFRAGYVSATWVDPDQIVVEVYSVPARGKKRPKAPRPKRPSPKPARRRRT